MNSDLLFGIIFGIVLLLWLLNPYLNKRRTKKLQAIAQELHCSFVPNAESLFLDELLSFHLFSQGRSRNISNLDCHTERSRSA